MRSGFPSVGKSSLMSGLTGTESVAAACESLDPNALVFLNVLTELLCSP